MTFAGHYFKDKQLHSVLTLMEFTYKFRSRRKYNLICKEYSPFSDSKKQSLNNSWNHCSPDDCTCHKRTLKKKGSTHFLWKKCWMLYCHKNIVSTFIPAPSLLSAKHSKLKENMKMKIYVSKVVPSLPKANCIANFSHGLLHHKSLPDHPSYPIKQPFSHSIIISFLLTWFYFSSQHSQLPAVILHVY